MLTVFDWSAEILQQWNEKVRPLFPTAGTGVLWPSERSARVGFSQINTRFAASDLSPLLAERGIELSSVQVWRLVTQTPERLSLPVARRSPLAPLRDLLISTGRSKSRLIWLRDPQVSGLLQDLAAGRVALTHEALQQVSAWRSAHYLRDLLMDSGGLPSVDRRLLLFQRWLAERLGSITETEHVRLLQRFSTWHQLRKLRAKATKGPLGPSTMNECRQQITQAATFLLWHADRGFELRSCTQADLDAWHADKYATRRPARVFLRWCMTTRRMPTLTIADRIMNYIQSLHDSTLAMNSTHSWLFPGRRTNQPTSPTTLRDALREIGLPVEKGRTAAIRQLVLQAPPPVIARALGYHDKSATRIAAEAGSPWSRYAPGDHTH